MAPPDMPPIALHIAADHPAFAGHFPGRPLVPGVLLLQLAQRAIEAELGAPLRGLANAKFLSPVLPGDALQLEFHASGAAVRFDLRSGSRAVAAGSFALAGGTA